MDRKGLRRAYAAFCVVLVAGMALIVGGSGTSGGGNGVSGGLPPATCPAAPAPRADLGPPTPRAGRRSLLIQMDGLFLGRIVNQMVMSKIPADSPFGVQITAVALEDPDAGPRTNLVTIRFKPAVRKRDGSGWTAIERDYTLKFQLLSYLLTPDTMPDSARRTALLGGCVDGVCPQNGALFALQFAGLWGGGVRMPAVPVTCDDSSYDLVDSGILTAIYNVQASSPAIPVPLDAVLSAVGTLGLGSARITGLDLSTDQDLSIALVVDKGSPKPFTKDNGGPMSWRQGQASWRDWGLIIEPQLVKDAAQAQVDSAVAEHNRTSSPNVAIGPLGMTFALDRINISADAQVDAPVCGKTGFNVAAQVNPEVCNKTVGTCATYTLGADSSCGSVVMWVAENILSLFQSKGNACASSGKQVSFAFGTDTLYATDLNVTTGGLALTGNSLMMDASRPPSTPAPACRW